MYRSRLQPDCSVFFFFFAVGPLCLDRVVNLFLVTHSSRHSHHSHHQAVPALVQNPRRKLSMQEAEGNHGTSAQSRALKDAPPDLDYGYVLSPARGPSSFSFPKES